MRDLRTTSKVVEEFGGRNPFIPTLKTSQSGFETLLIAAISLAMMMVVGITLVSGVV